MSLLLFKKFFLQKCIINVLNDVKDMETQTKGHKKFWKPPSFEDFNVALPSKKIKLDNDEPIQDKFHQIPNEPSEPKTVRELAIHPKKIEEIRNWVVQSRHEKAPILLITGPAGCGKTTTLKVSANEEGVSIKEWINPVDKTEFRSEPIFQFESHDKFNFSETGQTDKFEDFVFRSSRYKSLFNDGEERMLILVEDIPNIFVWKPKLFHEFLEKYKNNGKSPIVFILTDDQNLNLTGNLFPNHIKTKYSITNIKFNPVNHSSLSKNLKALSMAYCSEKVSSQFLEKIIKNSGGDLRSAANDLLLFLRTSELSLQKKAKKTKKDELGSGSKPLSEKDSSFDFYHIIGRILYPKLKSEKVECSNLNQVLMHDVQQIAEGWTSSFPVILHENYLQTFTKLKDAVEGADCFSFCDALNRNQGLEEYVSLIAIITLMLKNTEPKKTGFNPIKKSFKIEANDFDSGIEDEICGCPLRRTDFLLDVDPFLKILKVSNESNANFELCFENENCDGFEDLIEIEEYDD